MENLQQEIQTTIQKFQEQERKIIQSEFKQEVDDLKQELVSKNKRLKFLEQENKNLKNGYQKINEFFTETISKFISPTDEKGAPLPFEAKEMDLQLHSVKDRIRHMKHNPHHFSKYLSAIGKKMADYYRKAHDGADPSKRDEKINEKHTSPVCVYSEDDWEYLDYLIKISLNLQ